MCAQTIGDTPRKSGIVVNGWKYNVKIKKDESTTIEKAQGQFPARGCSSATE